MPVFAGLPADVDTRRSAYLRLATRYHSLVVPADTVPADLELSTPTVAGKRLLANFLGAPAPAAVGP